MKLFVVASSRFEVPLAFAGLLVTGAMGSGASWAAGRHGQRGAMSIGMYAAASAIE